MRALAPLLPSSSMSSVVRCALYVFGTHADYGCKFVVLVTLGALPYSLSFSLSGEYECERELTQHACTRKLFQLHRAMWQRMADKLERQRQRNSLVAIVHLLLLLLATAWLAAVVVGTIGVSSYVTWCRPATRWLARCSGCRRCCVHYVRIEIVVVVVVVLLPDKYSEFQTRGRLEEFRREDCGNLLVEFVRERVRVRERENDMLCCEMEIVHTFL